MKLHRLWKIMELSFLNFCGNAVLDGTKYTDTAPGPDRPCLITYVISWPQTSLFSGISTTQSINEECSNSNIFEIPSLNCNG